MEKIEWYDKELDKFVNTEIQLKAEIETLKHQIKRYDENMKQNIQDGKKIEELTTQMDELIKEKKEVDELVQELGDVIKQSDHTIEEYKQNNEDLRQKLWKAIRKIQLKDDDLDKKESELKVAYEIIEELQDRLRELGEEFEESDEDE